MTLDRTELRRRAEWIREHHDDTNRPARILVHVDDAIALLDALDAAELPHPYIDVVFDGPPAHESGRFVEVENPDGASVNVGQWIDRGDGLWALRIPAEPDSGPDVSALLGAMDATDRRARRDAHLEALMRDEGPQ